MIKHLMVYQISMYLVVHVVIPECKATGAKQQYISQVFIFTLSHILIVCLTFFVAWSSHTSRSDPTWLRHLENC